MPAVDVLAGAEVLPTVYGALLTGMRFGPEEDVQLDARVVVNSTLGVAGGVFPSFQLTLGWLVL